MLLYSCADKLQCRKFKDEILTSLVINIYKILGNSWPWKPWIGPSIKDKRNSPTTTELLHLYHHSSGFTVCLHDHWGSQQNIIPFNLLLIFHTPLSPQEQFLAMASISSTHRFIWSTIRCFATSVTPHPRPGSGLWCCCTVLSHILLADPLLLLNTNHSPTVLSHPFVVVCDCETQRNLLLLFSSLILVYHWRHWSFAGVPIASCAPTQQWKMWCSSHQNTAWYVSAIPEPKLTFSSLPSLCLYAIVPIYSLLGLVVKTYIRSSPFAQSILLIYSFLVKTGKHSDTTAIALLLWSSKKIRKSGVFFFSS